MDWNKWQESPKSKCTPRDMFSYYTATREGAPGERHLFSISDSGGWPQILSMLTLSLHFYQKLLLYLKGIITLSITLINLIRTTSLFRILTANLPDMFVLMPLHRGIHLPLVEGSPPSKDLPQNPVLKLSSLSLALPWPWSTLHRAVATPFDITFIIISTNSSTTSTNRGADAFQAFNNKIHPKSQSPSSPEISQKARLQCTSQAAAQQVVLFLLSS